MSLITYELQDKVALIGLNRPEKRNAINRSLLQDLQEAVTLAGEEADAAVLFGHGEHFSSGLDLAEHAERMAAGPQQGKRRPHPWHTVFDLIARGTIPFVAALHGATVGGGLELASAAHIRVADETTFFALPEGRRGIFVGGGGTVRIQRIIGYATMADMMLTGRILSAAEGQEAKIVQYLVKQGDALAKAKELATVIASNTELTNWQITNLLPRINDMSHDDGLFVEALNSTIARPPQTMDRLQAFLNKRAEPLKPANVSADHHTSHSAST
ncbi:MAG TPA: crotonase/enoyl-CoA hydratase family protein [Eoetvoesiella sp.]